MEIKSNHILEPVLPLYSKSGRLKWMDIQRRQKNKKIRTWWVLQWMIVSLAKSCHCQSLTSQCWCEGPVVPGAWQGLSTAGTAWSWAARSRRRYGFHRSPDPRPECPPLGCRTAEVPRCEGAAASFCWWRLPSPQTIQDPLYCCFC